LHIRIQLTKKISKKEIIKNKPAQFLLQNLVPKGDGILSKGEQIVASGIVHSLSKAHHGSELVNSSF
jgi:hypothetical protein